MPEQVVKIIDAGLPVVLQIIKRIPGLRQQTGEKSEFVFEYRNYIFSLKSGVRLYSETHSSTRLELTYETNMRVENYAGILVLQMLPGLFHLLLVLLSESESGYFIWGGFIGSFIVAAIIDILFLRNVYQHKDRMEKSIWDALAANQIRHATMYDTEGLDILSDPSRFRPGHTLDTIISLFLGLVFGVGLFFWLPFPLEYIFDELFIAPEARGGIFIRFLSSVIWYGYFAVLIGAGSIMATAVKKLPFRYNFHLGRITFTTAQLIYVLLPGLFFFFDGTAALFASYLESGLLGDSYDAMYLTEVLHLMSWFFWICTLLYPVLAIGAIWAESIQQKIRYPSYSQPPSFGLETPAVEYQALFTFRRTSLIYFGILSLGSAFGVVELFNFYVGYFSGFNRQGLIADDDIWVWISVLYVIPIGIHLSLMTVKFVRFLFPAMPAGYMDEFRSQHYFDQHLGAGFWQELAAEVGTSKIYVAVSGSFQPGVFGAAIFRVGLLNKRYVILIDPLAFVILKDKKERQAVIWHEIGHAKQYPTERELLGWILLHVWSLQAYYTLVDSFDQEYAADAYVVKKMGTAQHLVNAMKHLRDASKVVRTHKTQTALETLKVIIRVVLGIDDVWYFHPDIEIRQRIAQKIMNF